MVLDKAPAPGGKSSDGDAAAGASPAIKMFAGFSSTDDKARDSSLASAGPPTGAAIEVCPMGNLGSKSTPAAVLGIIWVTRILAVVLLAVGAAQWAYASDLQSKDIEIDDFLVKNTWGRVGQPAVGVLAVMLGGLMLLCTVNGTVMAVAAPLAWVPPATVMSFNYLMTQHEELAYERLLDFDTCQDSRYDGNNCLCFEGAIDYEGASITSSRWDGGAVRVSVSSEVDCQDIPDLSEDVLTSLILVWTIQGLATLAIVAGCISCAVRFYYR